MKEEPVPGQPAPTWDKKPVLEYTLQRLSQLSEEEWKKSQSQGSQLQPGTRNRFYSTLYRDWASTHRRNERRASPRAASSNLWHRTGFTVHFTEIEPAPQRRNERRASPRAASSNIGHRTGLTVHFTEIEPALIGGMKEEPVPGQPAPTCDTEPVLQYTLQRLSQRLRGGMKEEPVPGQPAPT